MKAILRLLGLSAIIYALPAAHAADLSGTWKGAFEFNGDSVPTTVNLKVADTAVTGTVEGLPTTPAEIHEGKIEGDTVSFWVNTDYQGQTYKIVFKGKIAADAIEFSFGTEDGSWGTTLTVKKEGGAQEPAATPAAAPASPAAPIADLNGAWKGTIDLNGTSIPLTLNLKSDGKTVTGTVLDPEGKPIDIHDGKLEGDTVTFWLNVDHDGQTFQLTYKGKVSPGQIDFELGTSDGSWGTNVTVKKA